MKKILFLEDEQDLADFYTGALQDAGHEVKWANTSEAALKEIEDGFQPDIAFLDQGINGNTTEGQSLLPVFKEKLPKTKVIMLSNNKDLKIKETAMNAGADDFLVKITVTPDELVKYVKGLST